MTAVMKYIEKDSAIIQQARGRKVMHLGCVGFTELDTAKRVQLAKKSLHYFLSEVADVLGVDYSEYVIEEYRKLGVFKNIVVGNVERLNELDVDYKFDVIVAGDIIEHVSNPGLMLEGIKRFCGQKTSVVITTPHAFGLSKYIRFILGKFSDGVEHVMTFNIDNIRNLLDHHGYFVEELNTCYQSHAKQYGIIFSIGRAFFKIFPKYGGTLFVVAKLKST